MAEFETADIPLKKCCDKYFGIAIDKAGNKARHQQLPVPCYRGGSQKSEWLVNATDLATYLDTLKKEAKKDWARINAA